MVWYNPREDDNAKFHRLQFFSVYSMVTFEDKDWGVRKLKCRFLVILPDLCLATTPACK